MSAVAIIKTLLHGNANLIAAVPVARILSGVLPQSTVLPAVGITEIVSTEIPHVDGLAPTTLVDGRVQVTVVAKDYASVKSVLALVRKACNYQRGVLAGYTVVSVRRLSNGPDFGDDAGLCMQSVDFSVIYYEPN